MTGGPNKQIGLKGVVGVAAICVAVAIALGVVGKRERDAVNRACFQAVYRNWRSIRLYIADSDCRYPIDPWKQVSIGLRGYSYPQQALACPRVWSASKPDLTGYAFNAGLVGQFEGETSDAPLFFETVIARPSVVTDFSSALRPGRHGGLSNFVTEDGARGQVDSAGHIFDWIY